MATKTAPNAGKGWTSAERSELRKLAAQNTPTRVIGLKLGRSPGAVSTQASRQHLSLKPSNQSPYGVR